MPPPVSDPKAVARYLGWWGCGALVVILVALWAIGRQVPALVGAVFLPRSVAAEAVEKSAERSEQFKQAIDANLAQVNGRSMFYVPGAPRAVAKVEEKKDDKPSTPSSYGGPRIIAMINNKVWFDDATSMKVGEGEKSEMKVVAISTPWSARIAWRGVEFDVPLFDRTTEKFLDLPPKKEPPAAEPAPTPPAAPPVTDPVAEPANPDAEKPSESKPEPKAPESNPAPTQSDPAAEPSRPQVLREPE
ncbi:MAG TPA: hypothetical protein VG797_07475 [Phycisphaerales bacterium]|nr:hypothetical protein [Phycisphaerales bacterium]